MDQTRFRTLMHDAIGEQPMQSWLATNVRARLAEPVRRRVPGTLAAVATILVAALVVAGLVLPQVVANWRVHNTVPSVIPAATPTAIPVSAVVDPSNCRLPVGVERGAGPPDQLANEVGFVDTRTGRYTRDTSASVAGLPGDPQSGTSVGPQVPRYYSPAVQHWLPVSAQEVAPDGRSYAWVRNLPVGSVYPNYRSAEVHVYNMATSADRTIWTHAGAIDVWRWDLNGIHVNVGTVKGNAPPPQSWWVVDPITGAKTRDTSTAIMPFPPFKPLPGDPHDPGFTSPGWTADGHTIWWIDSGDKPGGIDWVFYETTPGHRVYIYKGTQGGAGSFDPEFAVVDSTGIWFSDANFANANFHQVIWHWRLGVGLRKYPISRLPAKFQGSNAYVLARPAGPCF
jgi:hypothetical protein